MIGNHISTWTNEHSREKFQLEMRVQILLIWNNQMKAVESPPKVCMVTVKVIG